MRDFSNNFFIILLLSIIPLSLNALNLTTLINKAKDKNLSEEPYWNKLLHYENGKSTINNQNFFLSKNGKTNLEDELLATLTYLLDDNATCRYPARYKWLDKKLDIGLVRSTCKKLNTFLKPNYNKISIVFTSARYNSPASVFGHTFIKVESDATAFVIDYTAKIPTKVSSVTYAYKGIFGGYKSKYNFFSFFIKDYEYRNEEFRDLMDFELSFTKDEIENILLHLYEVLDTDQDYYFMTRNCSSELIKLIDFASYELTYANQLNFVTVPIDSVYILNKKIKKIKLSFSKLKLFNNYINNMTTKELNILKKIIKNKVSIYKFDKDKTIPIESKAIIIKAAIAYIEIASNTENFDYKLVYPLVKLIEIDSKYNLVLVPNELSILQSIPISNKFHRFKLGTNYISETKSYFNIGYRYLYRHRFDLVDNLKKHGSVELLDTVFRVKNNTIELDYMTILNLEAMPISNYFFKKITNKIKFGFSRLFYDDKLFLYFDYAIGYRYRLDDNFTYGFFAKTGVYYNTNDLYLAAVECSVEYALVGKFISEFKLESSYFIDFSNKSNSIESNSVYFNNYIKVSKNNTVNISLSHYQDIKKHSKFNFYYNINF